MIRSLHSIGYSFGSSSAHCYFPFPLLYSARIYDNNGLSTPAMTTLNTPSLAALTSSNAFSASSNLNRLVTSCFTLTLPEATRATAAG